MNSPLLDKLDILREGGRLFVRVLLHGPCLRVAVLHWFLVLLLL